MNDIKFKTKEDKYDLIRDKKLEMCHGQKLTKGLPGEFEDFLKNARDGLGFDSEPNYYEMKKSFRDLFYKRGYEYDSVFDWMTTK